MLVRILKRPSPTAPQKTKLATATTTWLRTMKPEKAPQKRSLKLSLTPGWLWIKPFEADLASDSSGLNSQRLA